MACRKHQLFMVCCLRPVFLLLLNRLKGKKHLSIKILFLAPVSLLCGWTHECISLPVSMTLGLYGLINIKTASQNIMLYVCILFYLVGTAFNIFAPATFNRVESVGGFDLVKILFHFLSLRVFYVYIVLSLCFFILRKDEFVKYVKKYRYLVAMSLSSLILIFLMGNSTARATFGIEFFFLLLTLALLNTIHYSVKWKRRIMILLLLLNFYYIGHILYYQKINYNNFLFCEKQLLDKLDKSKSIILTESNSIPVKWQSYVQYHVKYGDGLLYNAYDKEDRPIKFVSKY